MDGGAWWAAVHGVAKSRLLLSDFTFTFHFHALEKETATHSSVLARGNPRDGGASWAAVDGVTQSRTPQKQLISSRIPSLPLALFVVMLSKAHLISHGFLSISQFGQSREDFMAILRSGLPSDNSKLLLFSSTLFFLAIPHELRLCKTKNVPDG